jgi:allose kinase
MYVVGIDIGGTYIRIGLVDKENRVSNFERILQNDILKENPPENLSDFIKQYIRRHNVETNVAAVCAVFPASIDKERAVILNAPNINGFNGINVKSVLFQKLGYPVYIERDVNALLLHDLYKYNINRNENVISIYVGTGLGNAVFINGGIFYGSNGVAGELGHIPAWDDEEICSCGNKGCVENYIGGKYLERLCKEKFPQTEIGDIFKNHGGHILIEQYIKRLALVIAIEINIIDPVTVILGGGVLFMPGFPHEKLVGYIRQYARKPLPEANLEFVFSDNNGENGVIGAGIYAWNQTTGGKII